MTRLFIRFYLSILIVLFAAWLIYGAVLQRRTAAELTRVIEEAHGGGARLVASELDAMSLAERPRTLNRLREQFAYSIKIIPTGELPPSIQRKLAAGADVAHVDWNQRSHGIVAKLADGSNVVYLGPFPDYFFKEVENSIKGWARLLVQRLEAAPIGARESVIAELQNQFDYPIEIVNFDELAEKPRFRVAKRDDLAFFFGDNDDSFAATPLSNGKQAIRFGPFPRFDKVENYAARTTLALVLLPAALAIALLLRPVARQLRQVENAAKSIADGDLSARVDEQSVKSARPLAQSFNHMANRTETLVRTQRELLQAVSHDLRTPLARMRFAIELVESAKDDAERAQRLESLDAATEELDELVGELLSYVRMETSQPQLNREPIALRDAVGTMIAKHAALHPSVQFDSSINPQDQVIADRGGLQRALGNILSNAGHFAKSRVTIKSETTPTATIIDVDDDGNGIPDFERDRVFEPFVRLENGSNGHGVGLGLALVKRIASQHGGDAEVLNSPSGGCRVRTTWPTNSGRA